jgi:hypothetical protein
MLELRPRRLRHELDFRVWPEGPPVFDRTGIVRCASATEQSHGIAAGVFVG